MNKTYQDWLNYYKNATIEQIIEDVMMDNVKIKELKEENNQLKTKLKIKEEMVKIKDEAFEELLKENQKLKQDLEFVLEQTLGAFTQNWCIDWNFTHIREKYNISYKYDWNSDVDE